MESFSISEIMYINKIIIPLINLIINKKEIQKFMFSIRIKEQVISANETSTNAFTINDFM